MEAKFQELYEYLNTDLIKGQLYRREDPKTIPDIDSLHCLKSQLTGMLFSCAVKHIFKKFMELENFTYNEKRSFLIKKLSDLIVLYETQQNTPEKFDKQITTILYPYMLFINMPFLIRHSRKPDFEKKIIINAYQHYKNTEF